jgi:hypothetical protein
MNMVSEQAVFLQDVCRLISFAHEQGFTVTGGELFRTPEQQSIYMNNGKSKNAKSQHLNRCAIDLNFFKIIDGKITQIESKENLAEIGDYWVSLDKKNQCGIKWGWDTNHFERSV